MLQRSPFDRALSLTVLALGTAMVGCSGGGGGGSTALPQNNWMAGVFLPADTFIGQCAAPRTGIDPNTGAPFLDLQGSTLSENQWLRSWSNDLYLWYNEIVDQDPSLFSTPAYFDTLKTNQTTPSGNPKDQFHFSIPTAEWIQLSQSGVSSGYGAELAVLSATPPREAVVAFTQPNSPAELAPASLARGARIIEVDGVDFVNAGDQASVDIINAALSPATTGETHDFVVQDLGASGTRAFSMTSAQITSDPVQNVSTIDIPTGGRVGYLLFNDHIATAEQELIDAITTLAAQNIDDLVLDVRYNGGGFLFIASELAYMIAGDVPTAGRTFELTQFNDKHPSTNPVTGDPLQPIPFLNTSVGFPPAQAGLALPTLDLPRVFVLTGPNTCSASESIMNGLRGVDVEVVQIGSTTCGKPYGFFGADNCGETYFSVQFQGVNEKGFGDYADGFSPMNTLGGGGTQVPGCSVADDYNNALGDPAEGRLAAALAYRETGLCPSPTGIGPPGVSKPSTASADADGRLLRPPWREMRTLGK